MNISQLLLKQLESNEQLLTLLERMLKSTIGFSDLVEKNNHSKIIQKKYDFFIKNSMLSDCYFYLGYVNKENFIKIKDTLNTNRILFIFSRLLLMLRLTQIFFNSNQILFTNLVLIYLKLFQVRDIHISMY